jgi:hypothetical protein
MMRRFLILACCGALAACAHQPPPDRVALPPAPPRGEPVTTIGLTEADLRVQFGAPAFTRREGTAQLWRYDGASCRAFFFLYPDTANALNVRHVETTPRGNDMAADPKCLDALRLHPAAPAPVS